MSASQAAQFGSDSALYGVVRGFLIRRVSELSGLAAIVVAVATVLAMATYDGSDPSLLHATDRSPSNILGYAGSWLADPLLRSVGAAALFFPAALLVWGIRRILHIGRGRTAFLALFLLPTVLLATPSLAMLTPPGTWHVETGLGGFIGDRFVVSISGWSLMAQDYLDHAMAQRFLGFAFAIGAFVSFSICCGAGLRFVLLPLWGPVSLLFLLVTESSRMTAEGISAVYRRFLHPPVRRPDEARPPGFLRRLRLSVLPSFRMPSLRLLPVRLPVLRKPAFRVSPRRDGDAFFGPNPVPDGIPFGERLEPTLGGPAARPPARAAATPPQAIPEAPALEEEVPATPTKSRKQRKKPRQASPGLPPAPVDRYAPPSLDFLADSRGLTISRGEMDVEATAAALEAVLQDYRIGGEIRNARPGPAVTLFELDPPPGLKASRLESLADDIARSMGVVSARIATVPGSKMIGIEIPNPYREAVLLRELLDTPQFAKGKAFLPLALGKDILGDPVVADLEKMPHLLVAGTTGSGKSVAINAMILSLLYRLPPEDCRMILIDPKMLEFSVYDDIPHLLTPVVTDPQTAVLALKWVVREMEERYRMMSQVGVRNIANFNARLAKSIREGKPVTREVQRGFDPETGEPIRERVELGIDHLPRIVVVVDEMADLMMVAGKEIEACVQRLAQMARASGIHLIMATQRPSVDVITGTIKANFPTRISFRLSSKIDSRTILNEQGAEKLLGQGDMLYQEAGARVTRIHGPFVSEDEIEQIVGYMHSLGPPDYVPDVTIADEDAMATIPGMSSDSKGEGTSLVEQAIEIVVRDQKASTSYLQRKLGIGYNRAASVMEELEAMGAVSAPDHVGKRQILIGGNG